MTQFRVMRGYDFIDQKGRKMHKGKDEIVDVLQRKEAARLSAIGVIGPIESSITEISLGKSSGAYCPTTRYGFWIVTSNQYSGGRIHMFQFAWTLANLGAQVFIITNRVPKWMQDYPPCPGLQIICTKDDAIPIDIDVIITDSKEDLGRQALEWKKRNERIPFVCFNFETPNWVELFAPGYASRLPDTRNVFKFADMIMANSNESMKYLRDWLNCGDAPIPGKVLRPAVNTYALERSDEASKNILSRIQHPFAVWSARSADYKGSKTVIDTIWKLDFPFDLVTFGHLVHGPKTTTLHAHYPLEGYGDIEKYAVMKAAQVALAPSLFEGFGMVPGEAICCDTPCIVYDLPVLRQEYGNRLVYAKWNDPQDFLKKFRRIVVDKKYKKPDSKAARETYGMGAMAKDVETFPYFHVRKKRVSVQLITYWGFAPESLESIYDVADEIFIAYGRVRHAAQIDDGTLEKLKAFPDPGNKITLKIQEEWDDKVDMRRWCADRITGNYHVLLDGDEIWVGLDKWIAADIPYGSPRWVNFWHDARHWVSDTAKLSGKRWGKELQPFGSTCPHYRCSYWRRSYMFRSHPLPYDMNGIPLKLSNNSLPEQVPGAVIYHLGHALPAKIMKAKHEFYLRRDGNDQARIMRMDAWKKWDGRLGDCGDGMIKKVDWALPDIVQRAFLGVGK